MVKARENTIKNVGEKEKRFHDVLEDIFIGANIEGKSGFINLMKIKSSYFRFVLSQLEEDVSRELEEFPEFREELFDKLYNFFKRYFSESGSIHFAFTPIQENVWERVYTDKDTSLFWKTRNLYYVKTDRIWRSMNVKVNDFNFFFDASEIEHRKAYEKREIIYELRDVSNDDTINFKVLYSERGRKTDVDEILRKLSKRNVSEEILEKAFRIFEKQNEVDYFINKDANSFLKEQFNVWLRHYLMDEKSIFNERRLKQLKALRNIAFKIIDFISQFEDELRKVWEKPKFVLNSNYVITLDRIKELCGEAFLEDYVIPKVLKNEKQLQEWKELFGVDIKNEEDLIERNMPQEKEWKKLPIDTKNFDEEFKWKLIERICENHELDKVLDGWLIKSENWQALNTILPKFRGKVQTIYIDPPFNKEQDADYFYHVKYKDSTWITMLENRLWLAKELLNEKGSIFVRCDYNGNMYVRLLMNEIFGEENFRNEIILQRGLQTRKAENRLLNKTDSLFFYFKSNEQGFLSILETEKDHVKAYNETLKVLRRLLNQNEVKRIEKLLQETLWMPFLSMPSEQKSPQYREIFGVKLYPPKGRHWAFSQENLDQAIKNRTARLKCNVCGYVVTSENSHNFNGNCPKCSQQDFSGEIFSLYNQINNNWTDIPGYEQDPEFPTRNSEILLKRVIESTSNEGDLVMDFFLGSGTTTAVAHKLKRKWIGVEMGDHFYTIVLPRMKKVLAYDKLGISKEKDVKERYNEKTAGGFFKYYELEQYEQALNNAVYKDTHPFVDWASEDVYNHYVFLKDEKMLRAMEIDYQNRKVKVDLSRLYSNIDVAETLSNLKGKWIKRLARNEVEFEDGEIIDLENLDWKLIRPLIWW
jgi:adenine-specific DNA-methyltransferase